MTRKLTSFGCLVVFLWMFASCSKDNIAPAEPEKSGTPAVLASRSASTVLGAYVTYIISAGNHYPDNNGFKSVKTSEMKFKVKFDSSAIYTTVNPLNQSDINKLYGFSEGLNNQYNSARVGWNWYNNALNLYAYVYKKGVRSFKKITSVAIGAEHNCSIRVSGSNYIFTVNGISITLARGLSTATASGYQQYPYFGGDEVAPHKITIMIADL